MPIVGDLPARQIGVLVGSLLFFGVAYLCVRWIAARTTIQLLGVGVLWVVPTVLFEVGLGRFVLGPPWERITEDYDPTRDGERQGHPPQGHGERSPRRVQDGRPDAVKRPVPKTLHVRHPRGSIPPPTRYQG